MPKVQVFDTTGLDGGCLGPYMAIRRGTDRVVKGVQYAIFIAGAYNAMGLVGFERNGVVVLNLTHKTVVADSHMQAATGHDGATEEQVSEFNRLIGLRGPALLKAFREMKTFRGLQSLGAR